MTKVGVLVDTDNGYALPPEVDAHYIATVNAAVAAGVTSAVSEMPGVVNAVNAALVPLTTTTALQGINVVPTAHRNAITGWFHADGYGADRTNTNDSAAGIQAALTAAGAAGGGTVYIPDGQYKLSTWTTLNSGASVALQVPSHVALKGTRNAVLYPTNLPATATVTVIGTAQTAGVTEVTIEELSIVDVSQACIGILIGANYGQTISAPVTGATVRNNRLYTCSIGIHVRDGSSNFDVSSNYVINPVNEGIQVQNCTQGTISKNRILSTTSCNAIDISGENNGATDSACTYITVTENIAIASGTGGVGIFFETVAYCSCVNNTAGGGSYGIYVNRINSEAIGNLIASNQIIGGANGAMILNNNVWDTTITGNRFHVRSGTVGLDLNVSARGTIMGNVFFGSKTTTSYGVHSRNGSNTFIILGNQFTYFANDIVLDGGSFAFLHYGNATSNVSTPLAANAG